MLAEHCAPNRHATVCRQMHATTEATASFRTSAARPAGLGLVREGLGDILSRRRLIRYLVQADLKKKGTDTLFGNVWWVLDPLLQMLVYVVFVQIILGTRQPDYPLFIFAAILPWKWFASTIQDSILSVVSAERLIKQIHFPKLVLPLSSEFAGIANFAFGLIPLFALLLIFYRERLSAWIVVIPLIAIVQFAFTVAVATALSAVNVFYRDVGNVSRHVLRLWFYLSPGLWSIAALDKLDRENPLLYHVMMANPFAVLFESYRAIIYYGTAPNWIGLAILLLISLVLIGISIWFFKRVEPAFAKVL
jgi:ABC-type polysaccharide/polyol phosphate export permease